MWLLRLDCFSGGTHAGKLGVPGVFYRFLSRYSLQQLANCPASRLDN